MILERRFLVSRSLHMCICPKLLVRLKRLSSVKSILLHCSSVQFCVSVTTENVSDEQMLMAHTVPAIVQKKKLYDLMATVKCEIRHPIVHCMCFVISISACLLALRKTYQSSAAVVTHRPLLNLDSHSCCLKCCELSCVT